LSPAPRSFPLLVALRYLRSTRRDAFTSFLSAVAAGGIGLGVAALVLALAALAGMQRLLRAEILARTPALVLTLGLFYFVLNGLLLWGFSKLMPGYDVTGLGAGILGSLVIMVVNWVLSALFGRKKSD